MAPQPKNKPGLLDTLRQKSQEFKKTVEEKGQAVKDAAEIAGNAAKAGYYLYKGILYHVPRSLYAVATGNEEMAKEVEKEGLIDADKMEEASRKAGEKLDERKEPEVKDAQQGAAKDREVKDAVQQTDESKRREARLQGKGVQGREGETGTVRRLQYAKPPGRTRPPKSVP
jgi:hypothetical protein